MARSVGLSAPFSRAAVVQLLGLGRTWAAAILKASDARALAQRTALLAFTVRVASAGVVYLSQVLLARWLGGFDYGVYVFVWASVLIFAGMSSLGFGLSVARFIPEYREKGEPALLRGTLRAARLVPIVAATVVALLGAALVHVFDDLVESHYVLPLFIAFLCFPAYALTDAQDGTARAHNWIGLALVPPYVLRPLLVLLFLLLALALGFEASAATAVSCMAAAIWATAILQAAALSRRLGRIVPPGPSAWRLKHWIGVSAPIFLVDGFFLFMSNVDVLMLSYFRTPEEVGVYFAGVKTLALISFVSFAVAAASAHRFAQYHAAGDREGLERFLRDSISWTFWPSLAGTVLMLTVGPFLLSLFGADFTDGYGIMVIVAAGLVARAAVGPVERLLNVVGSERLCAAIYGAAFLCNIGLNLLLIPRHGIHGAAAATALAYGLEALLLALAVHRRLGLRILPGTRRRALGAAE